MSKLPTVKAFDPEKIHEGNLAFQIDQAAARQATERLLSRMSLAQKIHEIRGHGSEPKDSLWYAGGDDSLGLAPWKMVDGPRGARAGTATAFPVAIARAASFDPDLERRVGLAIGREVAAKGGNVVLAPCINLLRHPGWGRAQESYSEDPHHMGAMAVAFVSGAQNYVLTSPKHFALNNVENTRFTMSANVDERSLHEVYLPHFKRCVVEAGAGSIMTAYNRVNGTYCGQHASLLEEILRKTWGFTGFVESDWYLGTRSTAPALEAGMNIEMPAPYRFTDDKLRAALDAGELSEETIEANARRSIHQKIAWQLTDESVGGMARPDASVVECDEHVALAREAAEKSIVLLRNEGNVLPLPRRAEVSIALVGDLADQPNLGDRGSSMVTSSHVVTPREGIEAASREARVEFFGTDDDLSELDRFDVAVVVAGLTYRDEGEFIPTAQQEAEGGTLARGGDRETLALPPAQSGLIERVAAAARRTVVVLQGGSAILVRDWIDRVEGLVMAWYGGREGGHALARILFGDASPSGRLPVSFPRSMDQLMHWDVSAQDVEHDLLPGYRWIDRHGHEPEFSFGFGLGYTSFALSNLRVERCPTGFRVLTEVRNAGEREGATVVQLYVSCRESAVERPEKELRGFGRVELAPGASAIVEMDVSDEELSFFDAATASFVFEPCRYVFRVGQSAADLPLEFEYAPTA